MKKTLTVIFTVLIILVFIIFVFNQNDIIEMPFCSDVPSVYLEVGGNQIMGPYAWSKDEYLFIPISDLPSDEAGTTIFGVTYNGYDIGTCEGYVTIENGGYTLKSVILPEILYIQRCVRYEVNVDIYTDFGVWKTDDYMYYLRDEWPDIAGFAKFHRTREGDVSTDVYCYLTMTDSGATVEYIDVPISFDNILNSLSSTLKYLSENKPVLSDNDNVFDAITTIFWDYPSHFFKYISCFLEDFYIVWNY